jgi:hypothetical protein
MPAEDAPTEAIDLGYDEPCPIGGPPVVRTFASPPVPLAQPVEGSSEHEVMAERERVPLQLWWQLRARSVGMDHRARQWIDLRSEVAVAVPQHEPPVIRRRRDGRSSESSAIASVSSNSS